MQRKFRIALILIVSCLVSIAFLLLQSKELKSSDRNISLPLVTGIPNIASSPTLISANAIGCSNKDQIKGLSNSFIPTIRSLSLYQNVCGSYVANTLMYFTTIPDSNKAAMNDASDMVKILNEYVKYGISPIIIVEPKNDSGLNISFQDYLNGDYNAYVDLYFSSLHNAGIADMQMGTWIPFPEANLPDWDRGMTTPADFGLLVRNYVMSGRKYFPQMKAGILLDSESYNANDTAYANGRYISLQPYLTNIPKKFLNTFIFQGFPWAPEKNNPDNDSTVFDPAIFLNTSYAIDAANEIGVNSIIINTGTFYRMYTNNPNKTIYLSSLQRQQILSGILDQAQRAKAKVYIVTINLFAQDKSNTAEAIDWSYWKEDKQILKEFITKTITSGITLSLYDE